jgi:putative aldouronate transport system substrate-binding protein
MKKNTGFFDVEALSGGSVGHTSSETGFGSMSKGGCIKKAFMAGALCFMVMMPVFAGGRQSSAEGGSASRTDPNAKHRISWIGWTGPTDQDGDIVKILEEKFNVDFDMWDLSEGLPIRIAAGEIPDVFHVGTGEYRKYANDGIIAPVPWEVVQQYAPNLFTAYKTSLSDRDLRQSEIDGVNYGLDVLDAETGGFRQLIVYRGDWIERVGAKVPETLAEFEDLMYKFTRNDPDGNGRNDTYGLSDSMMEVVYGAFGYLPNFWAERDGRLVYGAIQPEMKDALTILAKWYKDGVLHPEFITGEHYGGGDWSVSNQFINGQIGVSARGGYLYWKPIKQEGEREGANITELKAINPTAVNRLVYGNPPLGPTGKSGIFQGHALHTGFITFGAQMADNPGKMAKALQILDYSIADYDGFLLTRFGVEGKHWRMGDTGFPVGIGNLSEWGQIVLQGGGATFNVGSWLVDFIAKANAEFAWGAAMPELMQNGIRNALFMPPPSNVQYGAELDKIYSEAYTDIITGRRPVDYFDTFVQNWRAAGGDIITTEANQ